MFSDLLLSILSVMNSFEQKMILERQREGIEKGKLEGKYRGRIVNTKESIEKFLSNQR